MKVIVNKKFVDKETGELHKVGDEIEVTEERLAEIQSVSKELVTAVQEQEPESEEAAEIIDIDTNVEDMTVAQLREVAAQLGIATTTKMKKAELIELIEAAAVK